MACAGLSAGSIALKDKELPLPEVKQAFNAKMEAVQMKGAQMLREIVPQTEEHAILCALSIGERNAMPKHLKDSFSKAGATHVLALSGLHIGIVFTLIYSILKILLIIPAGKYIRDFTAIAFIFVYSASTGFSPSVTRAAFMILIYRIAGNTFRNIGKWDAIALSALAIGIIAPKQIFSVGFHLSYAAVIGIALFNPVCKEAFEIVFPAGGILKGYIRKTALTIWNTFAISVCCQITTTPLVLLYFGTIPQYFLLANIIAVPLASMILYNLIMVVLLGQVPYIGEILIASLNCLLEILNFSIKYISD